jgi:hypothetical protein
VTDFSDQSVPGIKRVRETPIEGMRMDAGGPITQKFLETIEHNNNLINELGLDVGVANVNGEMNRAGENLGRHRGKHKPTLDRDIVIYADVTRQNMGDAQSIVQNEGYEAYKGFRIDFPSNANGDFFHDQYLPVCILQFVQTPGVNFPKMSLTPIKIATNFVKFDIYLLEGSGQVGVGTDLWINVFAMGRKGDYYDDLSEVLITPNTIGTIE